MLRNFKSAISIAKKATLVVIVFYIILAIFGNVISRNRPRIDDKAVFVAQQAEMYKLINVKSLNSSKTGKLARAIYQFTYCSLIGQLCTDKPVENMDYFKSSFLGKVTSLITLPYLNPPASGTYWVTNTLQNAGFIPRSYAAEGIGYSSIKPLMNLWKIFRDVTYLLIVLVLVSIGFMIMFRMKLNPQTVVSVENSLPKIVVALLLITFSFAIAGFLIDVMYLLILLSISILSSGNTYFDAATIQNEFIKSGPETLWKYALPNLSGLPNWVPFAREIYLGDAIASVIPRTINNLIRGLSVIAFPIILSQHAHQQVEGSGLTKFLNTLSILGNGVGNVPQALIGVPVTILIYISLIGIALNGVGFFLGLIVTLTVTALFFRIFFILFRSYLQIIISIIFAPLILLFEAVPGKSTFTYWLKSMMGELITFPIVITMLLIGKIMMSTLTYPGDYWTAPFLGSLNTEGFGVILGAGLIFITPDIIKFAKESMGVKPLPFNIGVGTFVGGAGTVTGGGMGLLQQFSTLSLGLTGIKTLTGMAGMGPKMPKIDPNKAASDEVEKAVKIQVEAARRVAALNVGTAVKNE